MIFDGIMMWFTDISVWLVNLLPKVDMAGEVDPSKSANFFNVIGRVACLIPLGTVIQIFVLIINIYVIEFLFATGNYLINKIPGINS